MKLYVLPLLFASVSAGGLKKNPYDSDAPVRELKSGSGKSKSGSGIPNKTIKMLFNLINPGVGGMLAELVDNPKDWVYFVKNPYSDWNETENQDCITRNTCITRKDGGQLFNIKQEDSGGQCCEGNEPNNTRWAFGSVSDGVENLTFCGYKERCFAYNQGSWGGADGQIGGPASPIGRHAVVHIQDEDKYYDIMLIHWGPGPAQQGGGFSWVRSKKGYKP